MSNLLEDVFIVENLQILEEGKSSGVMKVRGVFQRADEENRNGRVYTGPLLMREMKKLQDSIDNRRLVGELDHPTHDSVKLSNVSHLITKLEMQGKEVIGEAEILDTPMGKVAQALIKGGVQVGISSRGMGTLSEGQDGRKYVNEDFRLITWDLVADPSTRGAYPGLSESSIALANEICESMIPKVTAEKVFTTLLEEAFTGRLDEKRLTKKQSQKMDTDKDGDIDAKDLKTLRKDEGYGKMVKALLGEKMDVENAGGAEVRAGRLADISARNSKAARDLERSKKVPSKTAAQRNRAADLRNSAFRNAANAGHKADVMSAEIAGNTTPRPRGRRSERKDEAYARMVSALLSEKAPAKVVNAGDAQDRYVSGGRTGTATGTRRLMKGGSGQASASAPERVKSHTAGPKKPLPK